MYDHHPILPIVHLSRILNIILSSQNWGTNSTSSLSMNWILEIDTVQTSKLCSNDGFGLEHHESRKAKQKEATMASLQVGIMKQPFDLIQRNDNNVNVNAYHRKKPPLHGKFLKYVESIITHGETSWEHIIAGCSQTFPQFSLCQPKMCAHFWD